MKNTRYGLQWLALAFISGLLMACSSSPASKSAADATPVVNQLTEADVQELFVPKNAWQAASGAKDKTTGASQVAGPFRSGIPGKLLAVQPVVLLYASPTTQEHLAKAGIDHKINIRVWELFLRKYKIPFKTIKNPESLEKSQPGVLVLPSAMALSSRERQTIMDFRQKGGGVLSTWLTGVRDERGQWTGFSYMQDLLNVRVVGDTKSLKDVNFLSTYGDNPITHSLPAGQRVWLEQVENLLPLRLIGHQAAAHISDWSRLTVGDPAESTIALGESVSALGWGSRVVTVGYPERIWMSAEAKAMEAIAYNAIKWLLRQPDVYLATWPSAQQSALSLAIDSPEVVDDVDVAFAGHIEKAGSRATYYVLSENLEKSREALKTLTGKGHELAFMADKFQRFRGQDLAAQTQRLSTILEQAKQSGLSSGNALGFHAAMEEQDTNTTQALNQLGFAYHVAFMDSTDGRVPFLQPRVAGAKGASASMVVLPRTMSGPEDLMAEGDPEVALNAFFAEFELSTAMGALTLVRFPNQSLLTPDDVKMIFDRFASKAGQLWLAPNGKVAKWWLERSRMTAELDVTTGKPRLQVAIVGTEPLQYAAAAIVNLPSPGATLKLTPDGGSQAMPQIKSLDPWRVAVSLEGLAPGQYRWNMNFVEAASSSK